MTPRLSDPDEHNPLSAVLAALADAPGGDRLKLDDIVDHFGHRAFGALLFVFAVLNMLPLPPGSTTVLGLPLVLIAPQLMFAVPNLWLPPVLGRRTFRRTDLKRMLDKTLPPLVRAERLISPRLDWVFGPLGDRLIGLVCTLLALVLILPIPFGNVLPALAIAALSLGLAQRDGLLALVGYALAAVSAIVVALSVGTAVAAAKHLVHMLGI